MPRILRIINRFNLGGPTYNAAYLTKYLPERYETILIGGMKSDTEDSSQFIVEKLGITPIILPEMKRSINPIQDYKTYKRIKDIIREFKPDIVHTHASKPGALGRLAAYRMKVPVIVHTFHGHVFHSYFSELKTDIYKLVEQLLARLSTCIISISEGQKIELSEKHKISKSDKIRVIPLGFDLNKFQTDQIEKRKIFREEFLLADSDIAIAIVGRVVPIKNHKMFIRTIHKLKNSTNRTIRAFVVGDGEERKNMERYAREIGLDHSEISEAKATLTFTSWIKNVDYVNAGVDIIALTSKNEGTPVSLIEAQASNKPIVSTRVGGIENIVLPNETALLSEPDDEEQFLANLKLLVEDDDMRNSFAQKGWDFVKEKFHYERLVKDITSLYDELLNRR